MQIGFHCLNENSEKVLAALRRGPAPLKHLLSPYLEDLDPRSKHELSFPLYFHLQPEARSDFLYCEIRTTTPRFDFLKEWTLTYLWEWAREWGVHTCLSPSSFGPCLRVGGKALPLTIPPLGGHFSPWRPK